MSNQPNPATTYTPDQETITRIKHLSYVGIALNQTASEKDYMTNFFLAKEALNKFKERIENMNLDIETKKGILDLIEYLQGKVDRRIKHAETTEDKPMV